MKKLMLLGSAAALALSGMAYAQTPATEPAPDAAAPAAAAEPAAPAEAAAPAPAVAQTTAPAADAAATTPAAAPVAASADATAKVNADWAKYDAGNKGKLTALEFGTWVLAAKGQDTATVEKTKTSKKADLPAVKVLNATSSDFAKADTDKDKMISPTELATFLSA